ncbi:MAG TPA: type II toxin-antitoxin system RelE/ParE family toxin [Ignavibacteriaceae bacterium]|nr:type II toxin-antitoxin system RelE/ParE family toxin [Ignavibacteriaceae bacterium]
MSYKLLIDPLAKTDIIDIYNYVAENDSIENAKKLLSNLETTYLKLENLPTRGHIPPELRNTGIRRYREIHFKPYRIIYEIINNVVYVHCILDGRRNMQEILANRLLR